MKKEEYLLLTNSEKIEFLNKYLGHTKDCKTENEFVWAYATKHAFQKYDKDQKKYVELSEDEIQIQKEQLENKQNSNNKFNDEEIETLKKLIKSSQNLLDLSNDYKLSRYLEFSKNKYEVIHNLSVQKKSSKCFRVSDNLMEQVYELRDRLQVSDTDLVNYALYLLVNSLQ